MTDRELLELASRAINSNLVWCDSWKGMARFIDEITGFDFDSYWNPIANDGDALRLAVKLQIDICHNHAADHQKGVLAERAGCESAFPPACCVEDEFEEPHRMEATRRAIVRAAAEIGRNM